MPVGRSQCQAPKSAREKLITRVSIKLFLKCFNGLTGASTFKNTKLKRMTLGRGEFVKLAGTTLPSVTYVWEFGQTLSWS